MPGYMSLDNKYYSRNNANTLRDMKRHTILVNQQRMRLLGTLSPFTKNNNVTTELRCHNDCSYLTTGMPDKKPDTSTLPTN